MPTQFDTQDLTSIPATKDNTISDDASLVSICNELVAVIAKINSPDGPLNRAEAQREPEAVIEAARQHQAAMIDRLECLAAVIPDRIAASRDELAAKVRALDALVSVASWDRESLRVLRVSIGRDLRHIDLNSREPSPPHPHSQS